VTVPVRLIVEVPAGGRLERQLRDDPPAAVSRGEVAVVALAPDPGGKLDSARAGQVVMAAPAPETLTREPEDVHRVIDDAGTGPEPLVVVIEAAEELRQEELEVVLDAAEHTERNVIVRIVSEIEPIAGGG
jgi:hypothetical protein